jgi:hypothetical protein
VGEFAARVLHGALDDERVVGAHGRAAERDDVGMVGIDRDDHVVERLVGSDVARERVLRMPRQSVPLFLLFAFG